MFRHPHVFGTVDARDSGQALNTWDAQKREEKGQRTAADTLDSVARSCLPDAGGEDPGQGQKGGL